MLNKRYILPVFLILSSIGALAALGGFVFMYLGVYNIGATTPHYPLFIKIVTFAKERAVKMRAATIDERNLNDEELIKKGFSLYQENCVGCHGGPGQKIDDKFRGLNPNPPTLELSGKRWKAKEIAWIIKNGFKMTGMPGFELSRSAEELWALTAFVNRLNTLSAREYANMRDQTYGNKQWLPPPQGWDELKERGDLNRGRTHLKSYGCGGCHVIPGVVGARGHVGAPLNHWRDRHYIAGTVINNPLNLVKWLKDPEHFEPKTIMPNLDVTDSDAWDMASYLFSLKKD